MTSRAPSRFSLSSAKCVLRRRVYAVRAPENRCHSSSSSFLSSRGSAFHSSRRSRRRLTPLRQSLPCEIFSASATISFLRVCDSSVRRARSSRRLLRCTPINGPRASSRALRPAMSPTALGSTSWAATFLIDSVASSGLSAPERTRCSSSWTSNSSASKRRVKKLKRLLGAALGVLPDSALAFGGADVDGAVRVDPTPRARRRFVGARVHPFGRRAGHGPGASAWARRPGRAGRGRRRLRRAAPGSPPGWPLQCPDRCAHPRRESCPRVALRGHVATPASRSSGSCVPAWPHRTHAQVTHPGPVGWPRSRPRPTPPMQETKPC